jgi:phospholipid/cholesterol/gamma-HCH transport system substrate-binding protein
MNVTLLADNDQRFKNLFGKAALFVLLAVFAIAAAALWVGVKKGLFTSQSPIYFVADSGQDLSVGMPVKFSGFKIGKLHSLKLDEQGHVQVELRIETQYLKLIKQDSKLSLIKEGVIGDGVLDVSRGSTDKPILLSGATLRFERANGLEQAVMDIKSRVVPILDDVHLMLSDPRGDVRAMMGNFRVISNEISLLAKDLHATRQKVDAVLANVDGSLTREVTPLLRSLRQTTLNAETMTTRLDHDLPLMLQKVDGSLESLRSTSELMKNAVQGIAPQLPAVVGEARATLGQTHDTLGRTMDMVGSMQEVVDALSGSWPLKRVMPLPESGVIRMNSHD